MIISVRLRPGSDDDIIEWFLGVTRGDRSYMVREALRIYMQREKEKAARGETDIEVINTGTAGGKVKRKGKRDEEKSNYFKKKLRKLKEEFE